MSKSTAIASVSGPLYVSRMMERLGIEPGGGVIPSLGLRHAAAVRRCGSCASTRMCGEWLKQVATRVDLPPSFCPNSEILFELQFDQPGYAVRPMHPRQH